MNRKCDRRQLCGQQVYAWGDNDHGQQGNGSTSVNQRPTPVHGLDGVKVTRVACGSSHSLAWTAPEPPSSAPPEPVPFPTAKDPLGAAAAGPPRLSLHPRVAFHHRPH